MSGDPLLIYYGFVLIVDIILGTEVTMIKKHQNNVLHLSLFFCSFSISLSVAGNGLDMSLVY